MTWAMWQQQVPAIGEFAVKLLFMHHLCAVHQLAQYGERRTLFKKSERKVFHTIFLWLILLQM